ncbi:MAG: hypothetical protein FJW79_05200 [Actinobacteria bacterium]|nr:hypothetical protein [Actinomycetota bacterium]
MYANVVRSNVDTARLTEALAAIEGIEQRFAAMPGFEGACWLQPIDGHAPSLSFGKDEAATRAAALPVGSSPAPGVTIDRVETRPVAASACDLTGRPGGAFLRVKPSRSSTARNRFRVRSPHSFRLIGA